MIRFIIRRFIRDSENVTDRDVRESYGVLSGVVGICCNLLLFSGKLAMGLLTGSIAVISDAFNNLTDMGSSTVAILGAKLSNRPPDKDHPHGHGRVEYISSLVVAMIIFFVGYQLLGDSYDKVVDPQPVTFHAGTIVVLVLAILVKLWMFSYNRYIGRRINSGVNRAAAIDSLSDCVATAGVILSTILARFVDFPIDGLAGIAISLLILYSGFKIAKDTVDLLMGVAPAPENVARIDRIIRSGKHILGVHDLEVHDYGPSRVIASVHAEVPDNLNIVEAHASIDLLENRIAEELGIDIVIHLDPISTDETMTREVQNRIETCIAGMEPDVRIENFRIARLGERTVVIFELCGTPRLSDPDYKRIRAAFKKRIESCHVRYEVFIDRYGEQH